MTSKERVLKSLNHQKPDRVPLFYRDVPEVEARIIKDLNLNSREELLSYLGIDFRWVGPDYIGPLLYNEETGIKRDIWSVEYKFTKYCEDAGYWEPIDHPLKDCTDPKELEDYPWPKLEWFDFDSIKAKIDKYQDHAIMTSPGFASPGLLQSPIQHLIGIERGMMEMIINKDFFNALVEKILEFQVQFIDKMLSAANGKIDFVRIGDDYGTQRSLIMSPVTWRECIQPALSSMVKVVKKHGAYYYHHSCGAIKDLIPDMIDTGLDVLDPIQVKSDGMIPSDLKTKFGNKICFCGGVDVQELLREGTPEQVSVGVNQLLDDMAYDGGFFIGPTHNFQTDISTENILAMYEAAKNWS